jgi:hypothetical protein
MVTVFAQGVFVVVFCASFAGKIRDVARFRRTIMAFDVLPAALLTPAARVLVASEGALVVLLLAGLLLPSSTAAVTVAALTLAVVLLLAYTAGLVRVKLRQIRVSCNCFGTGNTIVSWPDVVRNGLFLLIGGLGLAAGPVELPTADRALVVLAAAPVALLLINFTDVVSVSQKSFTAG